jgi:hypothetical protein
MAINLWKLAGKPTSYNPLPNGYGNFINVFVGKTFVVKFKAKSISGASLRVQTFLTANSVILPLSLDFKEYTLELTPTDSNPMIVFYDLNTKGDIVIQDIELVQKPLPKFTINGIDGFLSGKWTLHPNAKVIDDETLVLNATGSHQVSYIDVNVQPNTNYLLNIDHNAKLGIYGASPDFTGVLVAYITDKTLFFNSGAKTKISINLSNFSMSAGVFTFKRPMLNLGTIPAPYEKKIGDRIVMPVPKKNLIPNVQMNNGFDIGSGLTSHTDYKSIVLDIPIGKTFTLSFNSSYRIRLQGSASIEYSGGVYTSLPIKFTSITGKLYLNMVKNPVSAFGGNVNTSDVNLQLEQNTVATPYESYAVQLNKKPQHTIRSPKRVLNKKRVLEAKR